MWSLTAQDVTGNARQLEDAKIVFFQKLIQVEDFKKPILDHKNASRSFSVALFWEKKLF